jgi:hypothetical protein
MTFDFLDDVFLLYLPFKPTQCIFKRLAFLYANLCQCVLHLQTSREGSLLDYGRLGMLRQVKRLQMHGSSKIFV